MPVRLLNEEDPIYTESIPGLSQKITLKQHQLTGLQRCIDMENGTHNFPDPHSRVSGVKTKIGIMGDRVGAGKSYTILSLLLANKEPLVRFRKVNVFGDESLYVEYTSPEYDTFVDMNIIVCSFSLIDQWKRYIQSFSSDFKVQVINRKNLMKDFTKNYESCNLVLVSSTFYQYLANFIEEKNMRVKRVIFDEADTAPTVNARPIPAYFYWFVTATYNNIIDPYPSYSYNSNTSVPMIRNMFVKTTFMKILRSLPYVDQCLMKSLVVRNNDAYIKRSFDLPNMIMRYIECSDHIAKMLKDITHNEHILRAVHAGDMNSAMRVLNKNHTGDMGHIINLVKEDLERELHNARSTIRYYESVVLQNSQHQQERIEHAKEEEQKIEQRINMLKERIMNSTICNICFSEPDNRSLPMCCKNMFCFECICKWLKINKSCPTCKAPIESIANQIMVINDETMSVSSDETKETINKFPKTESLSKLMKHIYSIDESPKVLIFSEYEGTFATIPNVLNDMNIGHGVLSGIGLKKNLERYKGTGLDVLMINSRSFGSGLNLENTTDIIMYHKFDESIEKQVIGRAQRPGREKPLRVWYLINETEVNTLLSNNTDVKQFYFR